MDYFKANALSLTQKRVYFKTDVKGIKSNNPSLSTGKNRARMAGYHGRNLSWSQQYGRWFLVCSVFNTVILHTWNEDIPFSSCTWKGKDLKSRIEGVGEREEKKSLFEDMSYLFLEEIRKATICQRYYFRWNS